MPSPRRIGLHEIDASTHDFHQRMARRLRGCHAARTRFGGPDRVAHRALLGAGLLPLASTQPLLVTAGIVLAWVATAVALIWLGSTCLQRAPSSPSALYVEARHPACTII